MLRFSPPSSDEHHRFLASFLFGGTPVPTAREAVWRAYLDLSRTVHGIRASDPSGHLRATAHESLEYRLKQLLSSGTRVQDEFDTWHQVACADLGQHFRRGGFETFHTGQAQKWLNMSLKYALTLAAVGWLEVREAHALRAVAHAPIDSFFLKGLAEHTPEPLPTMRAAWSRIIDYDEYFRFQQWLRATFKCPPLDVEFHVWQGVSAQRRPPSTPGAGELETGVDD
jgi:hypothetical protein